MNGEAGYDFGFEGALAEAGQGQIFVKENPAETVWEEPFSGEMDAAPNIFDNAETETVGATTG